MLIDKVDGILFCCDEHNMLLIAIRAHSTQIATEQYLDIDEVCKRWRLEPLMGSTRAPRISGQRQADHHVEELYLNDIDIACKC